jgi:hypothetical protein
MPGASGGALGEARSGEVGVAAKPGSPGGCRAARRAVRRGEPGALAGPRLRRRAQRRNGSRAGDGGDACAEQLAQAADVHLQVVLLDHQTGP